MSTNNQFDWVDFYKEFAGLLRPYKTNRPALIDKVRKIYEMTGINLPTLDRNGQIVDIDPFTVFGLFNKSLTDANRIAILRAISALFGVKTTVPTSFASVPVLNPHNATFYYFLGERGENDIDELWELFEKALDYADNPSVENRENLSQFFDLAIRKKGNGNGKITMGLFWIAPETFLNLDHRNVWYIYKSGKIPAEFVQTLPSIETKLPASKYFDIVERLRDYLKSEASALKDFKELSFEAWTYSEQVNQEKKKEKAQGKSALEESSGDEELPVKDNTIYGAEEFLDEVYMDEASYETLVGLVRSKKNVILQGAPGVGKTFAAERLAYSMMRVKDPNRIMMIQFHQSYSYEDFIMGFRPSEAGFELKHGAFYNFCKEAEIDSDNEYFFIIDEINRGNLSRIFGELFMLIENDKRGKELQLLYSGEKFSVPGNIYIIGMMNTADRSLAMLDYALRRRFSFFEMKPAFDTEGFRKYRASLESVKFDRLINCVERLNAAITEDESLGESFCIGHSFFCNLKEATDQTLSNIIEYELIPLLKEYWFDEPAKVKDWMNRLRSAIK